MSSVKFAVGDFVQPKPEWADSPNNIPAGRVMAIAPLGKDGALYVGDDKRAFAAYVFDRVRVEPIQADLFEAAQ